MKNEWNKMYDITLSDHYMRNYHSYGLLTIRENDDGYFLAIWIVLAVNEKHFTKRDWDPPREKWKGKWEETSKKNNTFVIQLEFMWNWAILCGIRKCFILFRLMLYIFAVITTGIVLSLLSWFSKITHLIIMENMVCFTSRDPLIMLSLFSF